MIFAMCFVGGECYISDSRYRYIKSTIGRIDLIDKRATDGV